MKKTLFAIVLVFLSIYSSGQIVFTDDFSDGDFTSNPVWAGEDTKFVVNGSNQLQLDAPAVTDEAYLSTFSDAISNGSWEFVVQLDFSPSTSNFSRVYIISDQADLKGSLNGYFVQIGGATGTLDDVSLYKQTGNTITKIIDGIDGTVATNPQVKIRVTRDNSANWELEIDPNLTGTYTSQGTVSDFTHLVSNYFGIYCQYTSTRSDKFFFDDFSVTGAPQPDIFPPTLDSVVAINGSDLRLYFNEPLQKAAAENSNVYHISTLGSVILNAVQDPSDSSIVNLSSGTPFDMATTYTIDIDSIADTSGNFGYAYSGQFSFYQAPNIVYGDVVINEIMAAPSNDNPLLNAEYIELFNASDSVINIKGWYISDATSTDSITYDFFLRDSSYLLICDNSDSILFQNFDPSISILTINNFPTLNNSGDIITIQSEDEKIIDEVQYTDDWYRDDIKAGSGFSLERINPYTRCTSNLNWRASFDADGGTPGDVNSILFNSSDTIPPLVESWEIISQTEIVIYFNEVMDSTSLADGSYSLNKGINVFKQTVSGAFPESILLEVTPNLDDTNSYSLTIEDITDCIGNPFSDSTFLIARGVNPQPFQILFNEIFPEPDPDLTSLPDAEYVEILNNSSIPLSLNGLTFNDRTSSDDLPNRIIFPGEILILTEDENVHLFSNYNPERVIGLDRFPSLNNSGDDLSIRSSTQIIDAVNYTSAWYNDPDKDNGGWALELINPNDPCLGQENWTASNSNLGGTPNDTNSVFSLNDAEDILFQSISVISDSSITLNFNRIIDRDILANITLSIDPVDGQQSFTLEEFEQKSILVTFDIALQRGIVYTISLSNASDCLGNQVDLASRSFILPNWNDLVVNEVLPNPYTGSSDFIEIYNKTEASVDFFNWSLMSINTSGDTSYKVLTTEHIEVPSNGFIVFTEDTSSVLLDYPNSITEVIFETDLPTYSNASGRVTLVSPDKIIIDDFMYDESMHFGLLDDVKGVSLERIDYNRPTNDNSNWHSASSDVGYATPGYENSQFSEAGTTTSEIEISPETFSPNNDGYEDFVNILYNFDREGYSATVKIYDANGREVKILTNNQLLGKEGVISWDGINENNEKASIGIYIIYVEIFTLDGDTKQFKETCVLATEL